MAEERQLFVVINAEFNFGAFVSLTPEEISEAKAQAQRLFGPSALDPVEIDEEERYWEKINWVFTGTPASGEGGWVAVMTLLSFETDFVPNFGPPLSDIYDLEIQYLHRTDPGEGTENTFETMGPLGSWRS